MKMKRLMIGVVVLALLIGGTAMVFGHGASAAALGAPPLPTAEVTAYGLNVRAGPGTAYPIVGGLSRGDVVEVVGKNAAGTWLQIVHPADSDGRGWISAAYVDLTGSLTEVPEVSAPPLPPSQPSELGTLTPTPSPTTELTGKLVFQVCNGCDIYVINADG
ncbi:MAG: SH3 domain-containing protein, partial [Anaerolineae bacterium]|nr:SH3 domain-containing protein [Anaerolineae bacterium]